MDKQGYPSILPIRFRLLLINFDPSLHTIIEEEDLFSIRKVMSNEMKWIIGILSAINIFRCFPTKVKVKLATITDCFSGLTLSIDKSLIGKALKDLGINVTLNGPVRIIPLLSAGPNAKISMWGSLLDMLALIQNPKMLILVYKYLIASKSYSFLMLFSTINLIMYVVYLMTSVTCFSNLFIGRLSIVYDQAGKARVVAITNWWIQCLFHPLHKSIFKGLKDINNVDGTFDQNGCLEKFISRISTNQVIYSYDLSAATDRLPIELQKDILSHINSDISNLWKDILSNIEWYYEGQFIKYSVGQPMGAYSSWAMLALTHHVIIRCAALKCGISDFTNYLVLGDDVVIADDNVSIEYLKIMKDLGLEINLSKSMISKNGCEFAKKWIINQHDFSPLGAKLLLQALRSKDAMFLIIADLFRRKVLTLSVIPVVIDRLGSRFKSLKPWCLLALISSSYWSNTSARNRFNELEINTNARKQSTNPIGYKIRDNLIDNYITDIINLESQKSEILENVLRNIFKIDYFKKNGSSLWGIFNLINPALFITIRSLFKVDETLWENIRWVHRRVDMGVSWDFIKDLRKLSLQPNIFDIDFTDKNVVSDLRRSTYMFYDGIKPSELMRPFYVNEYHITNGIVDKSTTRRWSLPKPKLI